MLLDARASGVLLHLTSLPSCEGIGDFGPEAYAFVDALAYSGQRYWQVLPFNPPACENSPYSSFSAFAINPLLISASGLARAQLLHSDELPTLPCGAQVHYPAVEVLKRRSLAMAFQRRASAGASLRREYERFRNQQGYWLDDYALFIALREASGNTWMRWPKSLALRQRAAIRQAASELREQIEFHRYSQFLLHWQLASLRQYAAKKGVCILGDMPFFMAMDSADVWSHRELFKLDRRGRPRLVSGVPPDAYSSEGQRWGNPLYDWSAMRRDGFQWWIRRIAHSLDNQYHVLRIDHFRGLSACWEIPASCRSARRGKWVSVPGRELLARVRGRAGSLRLVVEDLGLITNDVHELRDEFDLPGMRVLQFAFDGDPHNTMLPHNYPRNCLVYTGTHDNDTTRGWYARLDAAGRKRVGEYLHAGSDIAGAMIEMAMASVAAVCIIPMQDLLRLPGRARMNRPSIAKGNWRWRLRPGQWSEKSQLALRDLCVKYARAGAAQWS